MNPISEALACCPLKYPRELIQALERLWGRMGGEQREGQKFPLFIIGLRNQGFGGSPGWAAFPGKRVGEGIAG